jgi:hypothetical protein
VILLQRWSCIRGGMRKHELAVTSGVLLYFSGWLVQERRIIMLLTHMACLSHSQTVTSKHSTGYQRHRDSRHMLAHSSIS